MIVTLFPKPSTHYEECVSCGQYTGNAGVGDGSRYSNDGDRGPFCDACGEYDDRVVTSLRAELEQARELLRRWAGPFPERNLIRDTKDFLNPEPSHD